VYLGAHPKALAFVQTPKPAPSSFARESYFGITAMRFTNKDGLSHFGRYRIVPEAGNDHLSDAAVAAHSENFLFDELRERVSSGPIAFRVLLQLASSEDIVDDATVHWPEDRPLADLGRVVLIAPVSDSNFTQKQIIFDPIPRVDGIDPSEDPLLELRAALYLLSGRRRRGAR
jgi:catalase